MLGEKNHRRDKEQNVFICTAENTVHLALGNYLAFLTLPVLYWNLSDECVSIR